MFNNEVLIIGCETIMELKDWETEYRLPQSVQPEHYDLYLHPDLDDDTFKGHVTISLTLAEPRTFLSAHIKYLNVTKSELVNSSNSKIPILDAFEYEPNEFWVVRPEIENLPEGHYKLYLEFNGRQVIKIGLK